MDAKMMTTARQLHTGSSLAAPMPPGDQQSSSEIWQNARRRPLGQ